MNCYYDGAISHKYLMTTIFTVWIMTTNANVMINIYLVSVNTNVNANVDANVNGIDSLCVFGL